MTPTACTMWCRQPSYTHSQVMRLGDMLPKPSPHSDSGKNAHLVAGLCLRRARNYLERYGGRVKVFVLDWLTTFDRVRRDAMHEAFQLHSVPEQVVRVVMRLSADPEFCGQFDHVASSRCRAPGFGGHPSLLCSVGTRNRGVMVLSDGCRESSRQVDRSRHTATTGAVGPTPRGCGEGGVGWRAPLLVTGVSQVFWALLFAETCDRPIVLALLIREWGTPNAAGV